MEKRGAYAIRISGLGDGEHDFLFELNESFFKAFEHPDIRDGVLDANVILDKKSGVLTLRLLVNGEVEVACDRCLDYFMTTITVEEKMFVRTGDTSEESPENVIIIDKEDHEIGIGQYLYEFIVLALPYKRVHPEDSEGNLTCNSEMLKKLEEHIVKNRDRNDQTDPRWNALKDIIDKKN